MGTTEFLHPWMAADAVKISRTRSGDKLWQSITRRSSLDGLTYDGEYATFRNSAFRAKTSCGSERPFARVGLHIHNQEVVGSHGEGRKQIGSKFQSRYLVAVTAEGRTCVRNSNPQYT